MESLKELLEDRNIISLRSFTAEELRADWEVKTIIENQDIFDELYSRFPLTEILSLNDYYLYLYSLKLASMSEIVPALLQDEHKSYIESLSERARRAAASINMGDIIKYINGNIREIFDKKKASQDVRSITLDIIAKCRKGINKSTFEFLANNYGYLLIDRFDQFEKTFEQYPDLFELVYPTGHLEEINEFRFEKTLDVWCHIIKKKKSNLKELAERRIDILADDIKKKSEEATIDNIMQVEGEIRAFNSFLQRIENPKAYDFSEQAKIAAKLLSKSLIESGKFCKYEINIEELVDRWKETENWEERLLCLTHNIEVKDDSTISCISRLSKKPEEKHPLFDCVSTNIPTDEFFTISHQLELSVMASSGTGTMIGIINKKVILIDYLNLVASALLFVAEQLNAKGEELEKDIEMLSALVQMTANNTTIINAAMHGVCYGTTMFTCALSEKLLRILYIDLAKENLYIPINKATLGELLNANNTYMVSVFGEDHIRNLSFYLQQSGQSNVGENTRNSLAHWANISTSAMTPVLVAKMLWLFTDILNTVFWYCLKNIIRRDESDDQL